MNKKILLKHCYRRSLLFVFIVLMSVMLGFIIFTTGCKVADNPKPVNAKVGNYTMLFYPVFNDASEINGFEFYTEDTNDKGEVTYNKIENVQSMSDLSQASYEQHKILYYKCNSSGKTLNCVSNNCWYKNHGEDVYKSSGKNNGDYKKLDAFEWASGSANTPTKISDWFRETYLVDGIKTAYFNDDGSLNNEWAQYSTNLRPKKGNIDGLNTTCPTVFGVKWTDIYNAYKNVDKNADNSSEWDNRDGSSQIITAKPDFEYNVLSSHRTLVDPSLQSSMEKGAGANNNGSRYYISCFRMIPSMGYELWGWKTQDENWRTLEPTVFTKSFS